MITGGGATLAKISKKLADAGARIVGDEKAGYDIVVRDLEMPLTHIALNAGKDDAAVLVAKVQMGKHNAGYDALKDEITDDMLAAGIIDPAKVARMAVENAVSAAAMLLTTEAAVAEIPEPKKGESEMPPMDGGMDF